MKHFLKACRLQSHRFMDQWITGLGPVASLEQNQLQLLKDFVHKRLFFFPATVVVLINGISFLCKPWFLCIFRWSFCDKNCISHSWNAFLAKLFAKIPSALFSALIIQGINWINTDFLHVENSFEISQLD